MIDSNPSRLRLPTLYKISGTGKVLEWNVRVYDVGGTCQIEIEHGQQDGQKVCSRETVSEGKNIGRANETTIEEQADSQAESRWKKQLDKGYRETVEEAKKAAKAASKPMLAHKWTDKAHTLKEGTRVAIQAKLDGMRCLATKEGGEVTLASRGGKPITSVPHIVRDLKEIMEEGDTWDGELYSHDLDFETMMSLGRKKVPDPRHEELEFHVFDVVSPLDYCARVAILDDGRWADSVKVVPYHVFTVEGDFESTLHEQVAAAEIGGYEGIIIRRLDLPYEHKRSIQLLKLKTFHDEEFTIVGSETGTAGTKKDGILACFVCSTPEGKEFKAPLCGTEQLLREMWERRDTYVGELATCMFQEKTKYGVPRFPKCKGIRGREDLS